MSRKGNRNRVLTRKEIIRMKKMGRSTAFEELGGRSFWMAVGRSAAANAINENRAMNLPITLVRDGWVVRIMPDGRQERVSRIHTTVRTTTRNQRLTKGTVIDVKKH